MTWAAFGPQAMSLTRVDGCSPFSLLRLVVAAALLSVVAADSVKYLNALFKTTCIYLLWQP